MLLGRCRRRVAVFDTQQPRNRWSQSMNGFLTRDGIKPKEFIELARTELQKYDIELIFKLVKTATYTKGEFVVNDEDGNVYRSKKFLLATGLKDIMPEVEGIMDFYGTSVHHCQYCDGWESRDKAIAVYGKDRKGVGQALAMKTWSDNITLYTDGTDKLTQSDRDALKRNGVGICTSSIARLEGEEGMLQRIVLQNGQVREQEVLFFATGTMQQCDLGEQLGCEFTSKGVIRTRRQQKSNIPGLFVAGDASRDMQLVIVAAAEGAKAGVAINMELEKEYRK